MKLLPHFPVLVEFFCKPVIGFVIDTEIFGIGFSLGDPRARSVVLFSQMDPKVDLCLFGVNVVGDHVLGVDHEMLELNNFLSL